MNRKTSVILSGITLLFGGLIYICFRGENLVMFEWFQMIGLSKAIIVMRGGLSTLYLPEIVIYSLPDALWVYSLTLLMATIWINEWIYFIFWMIICAILGMGFEILQFFHLINGIFDINDLGLISAFYVLSIIQSLLIKNTNKDEKINQSN